MVQKLVEFLFILAIPLLPVAGVPVGLFAVGALFDMLDHPEELESRIGAIFRQPQKPPKTPGASHYYRAYWKTP